ncbi:aldehyde dehydrogenase family protein [Chitinophaga filiformis]|uniref:aldehyde dehydrogenase family protein n=1 Tax=Chitinophaga filiformis TaxID=104663 RepID=UPI001F40221F|nr:aldehyde dehydrogenase family protein [Chitinophaga filiformis]MCF6406748.1 aldehyde dehydrogenase family protein [Chitinophaga filiformis]
MKQIDQIYVNGKFTNPKGTEKADIISPVDGSVIAQLTYANESDTNDAIAAASEAFKHYSQSTIKERTTYLQKIHDEIMKRMDDLIQATIIEYGATKERAKWSNMLAATTFASHISILEQYPFERKMNESKIVMEPVGVAALFTPWNSSSGSIAVKLAPALAAGCTVIIKPSEFSPWQSQIIMECIDAAGLPAGVVNMVNGRGDVISKALMASPAVTKIAFTGSTQVGKMIAQQSVATMKRLTLELSGKSANIILNDADISTAIPLALQACFMNNGQACIAGSRLLIPEAKMAEVREALIKAAGRFKVGRPYNDDVNIGPVASQKQYDRIQQYINIGIEEGAELIWGGPGRPEGLDDGYYVKPTIFMGVNNNMRIAREEVFGPLLSVIPYKNEEEAIAIANDTEYGLMAYISSKDNSRAEKLASKLQAGRVLINTLKHDPLAPFGGFKHSGIGRENGAFGLEAYLEVKVLIA